MVSISGGHVDPHLRRWMLFVDGENLAIEGQKLSEEKGIKLADGPYYWNEVFLWFPNRKATERFAEGHLRLQEQAIRAFYYTSVVGNEERQGQVEERLWKLGFNPEVFKKPKDGDAKGVDISLTKDMLSHAFRDHYDVAVLIAGDGDYVPLVKEVKSLGKVVYVGFFERKGLSPKLRLAADRFTDITQIFRQSWQT